MGVNVRDKKVTVVGMGRTAVALAKLLLREGAHPFITEQDDRDSLAPFKEELDRFGIAYECGGHTDKAFEGTSFVIPSPGVSPSIEPIQRVARGGVPLLGEMEFAFRYCRSRVLAVTGTNGKTTTTELLRALLAAAGCSVALAGNNDCPFSDAVMLEPAPEFIVVEVSSYQLETAWLFRPWIGAVLNITPDHLERHKSLARYARIKQKLFANQGEGDVAVLNHDDSLAARMHVPRAASLWSFSIEERVPQGLWLDGDTIRQSIHGSDRDIELGFVGDNPLPGRHNLQNALAALTMARAGGFEWPKVLEGLRGFKGVEHRIEHVVTVRGVAFYNDSKSTNLESLRVALESFSVPVVLLAGGRGKGGDYRALRDVVRDHVKCLVTLGEDGPLMEAAYGDLVKTVRAVDMESAVRCAAAEALPGEIVLLSPACASFDMFENFEHRGRVFKECVLAYAREVER